VTRETFLSEATFVFPRDLSTERELGVSVRIFTPDGEIPFAGHPTLGTAAVLRQLRLASKSPNASPAESLAEISLDLKVGKVPVTFRVDGLGKSFGEMRQVPPQFGSLHDKETVARLHNLTSDDIADFAPIQTVSTGLPYAIVPLKRLESLQTLRINDQKMNEYVAKQDPDFGFYYVTRDAIDAEVALRARCVFVGGEDAATGSAAGCTAAWLVRYGVAAPDQSQHIRQGVEMKRPSDIFVRAGRDGDKIVNVRVGGYAVQTMEGEIIL
jgi:trans-2,3-dihydro-3-hydroxyanthranilate isomerase